MSAIPFDTLKLARRLEAAGFSAKQAGDTAEALAEAVGEEMTTKNDLEILKRDLKIWFGSVLVVAVGVILAAIRYLPAAH